MPPKKRRMSPGNSGYTKKKTKSFASKATTTSVDTKLDSANEDVSFVEMGETETHLSAPEAVAVVTELESATNDDISFFEMETNLPAPVAVAVDTELDSTDEIFSSLEIDFVYSKIPEPVPSRPSTPYVETLPTPSPPKPVTPAPVIDQYLTDEPGSSKPRDQPQSAALARSMCPKPVSSVFGGKQQLDLDKLTDQDIISLALGNLSDDEDTEEEEILGDADDEDTQEEEILEGAEPEDDDFFSLKPSTSVPFSDVFLVERVGSPLSPPRHTSPTPGDPPEILPAAVPSNPVVPPRRVSDVWSPNPVPRQDFPFLGNPGIKFNMEQYEPWDFFKLLFTDEFLINIVEETNQNALHIVQGNEFPRSRISSWKPLSLGEFYIFLGVVFHMGHVVVGKIRDYWRTDRLYRIPFFPENMSRDRFEGIMATLYFHRRPPPDEPSLDRLNKLRPIIDHFNNRMEEIYYPKREMSIDESMILWRGRLAFRQYVKGKRHKFGVKLYILAEDNGLVQKMIIYTGKGDQMLSLGQSHAHCVVDTLLQRFRGVGHSIFMDNFFTSVPIVTHMMNGSLHCTGTLNKKRRGNPPGVVDKKIKKGEVLQRWNEDGICVIKWRDKRDVLMISSEFNGDLEETQNRRGQSSLKPKAVVQYNKYMGGVDRLDQLLSYSLTSRKSIRWYKKVVLHIFQIMIANAYNLYKCDYRTRYMSLRDFRNAIVLRLIDEGKSLIGANNLPVRSPTTPRATKHYPQFLPVREGTTKHKNKNCKECYSKGIRKGTVYTCSGCPDQPGLCVVPCFGEYHTRKNL